MCQVKILPLKDCAILGFQINPKLLRGEKTNPLAKAPYLALYIYTCILYISSLNSLQNNNLLFVVSSRDIYAHHCGLFSPANFAVLVASKFFSKRVVVVVVIGETHRRDFVHVVLGVEEYYDSRVEAKVP